jgi:chromosome partitioning protein
MRTIALMNQKGGVGKTTTTVNLGAALAERGRRVLLIDLDPQAHLTITYGVEPADGPTLYEVLAGDVGVLQATRRLEVPGIAEKGGEIHVLPGSLDLAGLESEMADVEGRQLKLREAMERAAHDYDYVLLDCPPSLGLLTVNALALADEVLIPMQAHFLALQGFAKLLETTQLVGQSINQGLKVCGVVLTMFDAQTRLGSDVVNELQGFFDAARGQKLPWSESRLYDTKIRRNIKLAEAPSFGQSILAYDPASNGAADYRALAAEMEADLNPAEAAALEAGPALEPAVFRRTSQGLRAGAVRSEPTHEKLPQEVA